PAIPSSIRLEDIAGTSDRLEIARELDVLLYLAAQSRHLHVDGADVAAELRLLGERLARDGDAGALDENAEQRRLGGGEMHELGAAGEFAAVEIEAEGAEADVAHDLACRRRHTLQDVADAQHQLARLEGLGEIVVGAALEAGDAVLGLGHRGQEEDRHTAGAAKIGGELEAALARHHDVEHE